MPTDWLIAGLIIIAAVAVSFALPWGKFVRFAIVAIGVGLSVGATQAGRDLMGWDVSASTRTSTQEAPGTMAQLKVPDEVTVTYRVTATVRVDGDLRTASSLQQVTIRRNLTFGLQAASNTVARSLGESIAVPIIGDGYLLVTMLGRNSYENELVSPCRDWRDQGRLDPPSADEILSNAASFSGSCAMPFDRLPVMLAVRDAELPTGFVAVSPPNLSPAFGVDAEFVSLVFERTNEPLEYQLHEHLRWIEVLDSEAYKFGIEFLSQDGRKTSIVRSEILTRGARN